MIEKIIEKIAIGLDIFSEIPYIIWVIIGFPILLINLLIGTIYFFVMSFLMGLAETRILWKLVVDKK